MKEEMINGNPHYMYFHKNLVEKAGECVDSIFNEEGFVSLLKLDAKDVDDENRFKTTKEMVKMHIESAWLDGCHYAVSNKIDNTAPTHEEQMCKYHKEKDFAFMFYFDDNDFGEDFRYAAKLYCDAYNYVMGHVDSYEDCIGHQAMYIDHIEELETDEKILLDIKMGIASNRFSHTRFYEKNVTFDQVKLDVDRTLDYLDIDFNKDLNLYSRDEKNGTYIVKDTVKRFKKGSFNEIKEHAVKLYNSFNGSRYAINEWEQTEFNGEMLFVYMEDGLMKYIIK